MTSTLEKRVANEWSDPNCLYCGQPVKSTGDPQLAPYWLPHLRGWSCAPCYRTVGEGAPRETQAQLTLEDSTLASKAAKGAL